MQITAQSSGLVALAFTAVLLSAPATAASTKTAGVCDPGLRKTGGAYGYQMRGDRCEGLYARPLSALSELRIVSMTRSRLPADGPEPPSVLRLSWPEVPSGHRVRIRIYSLNRSVYYRMDAALPTGSTEYEWPTDVLRAVGLSPGRIGYLAWAHRTVGDGSRQVLLPLTVGADHDPVDPIVAFIKSSVSVEELYLTIARTDEHGTTHEPLVIDRPLGRGYYPADVAIPLPLESLAIPGLYVVEIGATFWGKGSSALSTLVLVTPRSGLQ